VYGEDEFEDRFRMPRPVFNRLFRAIYDQSFWRRSVNATGRPQAHAIQKVAAALRVLGYGESFNCADEYCCLSRSTIDDATHRLTEFIIDNWESTYLRRPTDVELEHILACLFHIDSRSVKTSLWAPKGPYSAAILLQSKHTRPARPPTSAKQTERGLCGQLSGFTLRPFFSRK